MATSLEEMLITVWQQALVDDAKMVALEGRNFPVRRTSRSRLREVDFQFEGHELRGLEQNSATTSRCAQLARKGKKVMQFLEQRRYIAVVVDAVLFHTLSFRGIALVGVEAANHCAYHSG